MVQNAIVQHTYREASTFLGAVVLSLTLDQYLLSFYVLTVIPVVSVDEVFESVR